jgi:hypothetical protein
MDKRYGSSRFQVETPWLAQFHETGFYRLEAVQIIAKQNADSEGHLLVDRRSIAVAALPEPASPVVRDSQVQAPSSDDPSANAESCRDLLFKHTASFQSSEKLLVGAAAYAARNILFFAPMVYRTSGSLRKLARHPGNAGLKVYNARSPN